VGESGGDEATHVDLPDPLRSGPGEQGMLFDERQRVLDGGLMGPFNHSRHPRISDCPQRGHRLHRGERQVITSHGLCLRPRVFRDLPSEFPGIHRFPAMLGTKNSRAT
jgi:hypothetical protein